MAAEPSSRAIEPSLQNADRPIPPSPREVAIVLGWFFGWPVVIFACIPFLKQANTLCFFCSVPVVSSGSCHAMESTTRCSQWLRPWKAATTIRKVLGIIVGILRVFQRSLGK
jgi:hypothetical protein